MMFPPITSLTLLGVYDAGVSSRERILIRPTESVNLAQFGVLAALQLDNGQFMPLWDHYFWFGETLIEPPSWLVLFTCPGTPELKTDPKTGYPIQICYWQRKKTLFHVPKVFPILFQMNGVLIGGRVSPQLPS